MNLITPISLGGTTLVANVAALAPNIVSENLNGFWKLERQGQILTLASVHHYLGAVDEPNQHLLEGLREMIARFQNKADPCALDNLVFGQLIMEWGKNKPAEESTRPAASRIGRDDPTLVPITPSVPAPGSDRPDRPKTPGLAVEPTPLRRMSRGETSMRFYSDGTGGFFPPIWINFSKEMRDALKILAYGREGKMSDLTLSEEAHAGFLLSALAGWIEEMKTALTETGTKGAGASGLASAPSIRALLTLVSEMTGFLADPTRSESLSDLVWRAYGVDPHLRMSVDRLSGMRMAQSVLEEDERAALEKTLRDLDAAYLAFLLQPLLDGPEDAAVESGNRDESYGETLARTVGDALVGLPLSDRARLSATAQVQLTSAATALRTLARELRADRSSPAVRGFLKKLLSSEMLRLSPVVALIQEE